MKLTAGTPGMLQTPVAEDNSAIGKAATAETLAIAGNPGKNRKNTSTAGPTATQDSAGTTGNANNRRGARTGSHVYNRMEAADVSDPPQHQGHRSRDRDVESRNTYCRGAQQQGRQNRWKQN